MTPEQQKLYGLYFPPPDMYRFGNNVEGDETTNLRAKYAWMKKPFAQATGMGVPVVTEKIKENNPYLRGIAERLEALAQERGVDDNFSSFNFIDKDEMPEFELPDFVTPLLPSDDPLKQTDIDALLESLREIKENPIGKYIVIALAVIAFILILKMLS
jgi:hypothetical protein